MARNPNELANEIIRAYPNENPEAKGLWDRYDVPQEERDNYAYYGFGENDVRQRIKDNAKRYGHLKDDYADFEEAQLDLIADIEHAFPDLYEKKWGRKHPEIEEGETITPEYLKDLAKIRAAKRGGDLNLATKELNELYKGLIEELPEGTKTLGQVLEEKQKAKRQAKYNAKHGLGKK